MRIRLATAGMPLVVLALTAAVTATAQGPGPPPQTGLSARLASEEPLTTVEIGDLLNASQAAMSGKAFRTYGGFGGAEFLADDVGLSIISYGGERLTHYTRIPATICPGTPETAQFTPGAQGNLVVEYARHSGNWTVRARGSAAEE